MGYIRHHAIVVTAWDAERAATAYSTAIRLGLTVTPPVTSPVNGYRSFLVVPDGSKEGWEHSEQGDQQRREFIAWLIVEARGYVEWAEVAFGNDDESAKVTRHTWQDAKVEA